MFDLVYTTISLVLFMILSYIWSTNRWINMFFKLAFGAMMLASFVRLLMLTGKFSF